ncbi:hypothetical protein [Amycolatopsis sp. 195334CR]|uniref:hypothetical protein n=1 Tax=Amycolatopsis sp. 195334CR TaxID=2814588 RepID=UPI001A8CF8A8|nr:hypothetical protein [Amycolatopsis sp. 195334CR]MBN6037475.1 hypothetical protein [Amycolatopsis sp. 195334CR]
MGIHQKRLKVIEFTIDGTSFECQVNTWNLDPGIEDGDRLYSFCPDGEAVEETDPEPTLEIKFFSDWRSNGISAYLWEHNGETAEFELNHHPNVPGEHVKWTGELIIKPGPAGGEVRETEFTEVTFQCVGLPVFERVS